jgi:hypothetical protein
MFSVTPFGVMCIFAVMMFARARCSKSKNAKNRESAYTSAAALIAALDWIAAQAGGNLVEGRKRLVDKAELIAAMTRAAGLSFGYPGKSLPSRKTRLIHRFHYSPWHAPRRIP